MTTNPLTEEELDDIGKGHERTQAPFGGPGFCRRCSHFWPCPTARLVTEVRRLNEEIMGHQVRDGYDKGYEHGQAAAVAEVLRLRAERDELRVEVQRLRLAAAWAEGVIEDAWNGYGPTHDPAWERFRAALNAPSTAWKPGSGTASSAN